MWECCNLNFIDGKLGEHSSRVTFSRMQGNLGHNYVNTQADHWSQLLPGVLLHIAAYSHVPPPCAGRVGNKHSREITVLFLNRVNFSQMRSLVQLIGQLHWDLCQQNRERPDLLSVSQQGTNWMNVKCVSTTRLRQLTQRNINLRFNKEWNEVIPKHYHQRPLH